VQIGGYQVEGTLGEGGMGAVYAARDPRLGRRVAIKVLTAQAGGSDEQRRRFQREAQALARLRHPGIVVVHEVGTERGAPYLVMDLVEGRSLAERLDAEGPLPSAEAARITAALADALAHAHDQGILHRDLKPANVLLAPDGRVLLTDFGLAKELDGGASRLSKTGSFLGTPGFSPPEQVAGNLDAIGPAADVYALGATLYAMLTGVPPHQGESLVEVVGATLKGTPERPSKLRAGVDPALEAVCLRCLEKDPARRPASPRAVALDLVALPAKSARGPGLLLAVAGALGLGAMALAVAALPSAGGERLPRSSGPEAGQRASPEAGAGARGGAEPVADPEAFGARLPTWFRALAADERPPLPLPPGLEFGEEAGHYLHPKSATVLVYVPPGSFRMGYDDGDPFMAKFEDRPVHQVALTRGYFLGRHEVTWAQLARWFASAPEGDTWQRRQAITSAPDQPAHSVSWVQARAFCAWAGLRLPTEAEWEHAARGPQGWRYPWGDDPPTPRRANGPSGEDGYDRPAPVGAYPKGAAHCGALDMAGNLFEWVEDVFAPYPEGAVVDPIGPPTGELRGVRGGGYGALPNLVRAPEVYLRAHVRCHYPPEFRDPRLGFRVALSAESR
jgi:formylglycine-generating enzyme required for sulfatase activity